MERVQRGDGDAYLVLLDDLAPVLRRFLARRVRDGSDLDDVYQDTLLALHRARNTYEPGRPFDAWFFAIAKHVSTTHFRRSTVRARRESLEDAPVRGGAAADEGLEWRLRRALDALPVSQRTALHLLRLRGLSLEEAAVEAGTTVGAMKVRVHRAFKALRRLLVG